MQAGDNEGLGPATVGQCQRRRSALEVEIRQKLEGWDVVFADRNPRNVNTNVGYDPGVKFLIVGWPFVLQLA